MRKIIYKGMTVVLFDQKNKKVLMNVKLLEKEGFEVILY